MFFYSVGKIARATLGICAFGVATTFSHALITFSNVTISGTPQLIAGASFATGSTDIDFTMPNAIVGDFQPLRQGVFTITYEATGINQQIFMDQMILSVLGGVSGSGMIVFSEVIEDMVTPGIIGQLSPVTITSNSQLPWTGDIWFTRSSSHIKVKKDFFLMANPDTQALDLARVTLIEQNLNAVPEPASMLAIAVGVSAMISRRRKK